MFTCNNLNLLTFTYFLKLFLGISMTIIPFIYLEKTFIKIIKYKEKHKKLDKFIFKKQIKGFIYVIILFILAFTLHNSLNKDSNVCYTYANKDVFLEYIKTYKSLENKKISLEVKEKYLENTIIKTYNSSINKDNKKTNSTLNLISSALKDDDKVDESIKEETLNLIETDYNKFNNVYVVDGVFYYPLFRSGNWSTYSGTSCPSDPASQGYNNPYGYNNYFYTRLTKFIADANENGYKITFSTQGCRTYNTQVYYYNTMVRGRAAYPGYSLHGFGIASDLEFYQSDGSICGYGRTDSSCPSMGWAHQNASKYGLTFPLLQASYREDWHIEPINKNKY